MSPRFRSAFAAPTGFIATVTRPKPRALSTATVARLPVSRTAPPAIEAADCAQAA